MRIGVVVNPIAGMGGRVGLKGTDDKVEEARARGAEPRAPDRAVTALKALKATGRAVDLYVYGGQMGATEARDAGFEPVVVGTPDGEETTAADTKTAVRGFIDVDVDLILVVGGDGTAVDVAETLQETGADIPMLGVPAGVKVYSSVFGVTPEDAGRIAGTFVETESREVVDLDEAAYRQGEVRSEIKAVVAVPVAEDVQPSKQTLGGSIRGLADAFADEVTPDVTYVLGPGGTVGEIKRALGFTGSPLGVDVWRDGEVVVRDGSEREILDALTDHSIVVVSPIGGQGFIFGRGNDQLSPAVIKHAQVQIVASKQKLDDISVLRVDTGNTGVDGCLRGWHRVRIGRYEHRMMKVT